MEVRDRIKELRRVRAADLLPNPKNWRVHPPAQADALRGLLSEIGYADALLVRETPRGLEIIDGHLRAETTRPPTGSSSPSPADRTMTTCRGVALRTASRASSAFTWNLWPRNSTTNSAKTPGR